MADTTVVIAKQDEEAERITTTLEAFIDLFIAKQMPDNTDLVTEARNRLRSAVKATLND